MKKKLIISLLCCLLFIAVFPTAVSADIGPKPSVVIDFAGLEGQTYYATLLADVPSTGPYSELAEGHAAYSEGDPGYSIYRKFVEYSGAEGFYFLQFFQDCSESHRFSWTYYPPQNFKILVYFPSSDSFAVSTETYSRYAFDSYFRVSLSAAEVALIPTGGAALPLTATESYDYTGEIISLVARVVLTIAAELLIARLFAFRGKKLFKFIAVVNLATQLALNVLLNLINYKYGQMLFVFAFVAFEALVFAAEAVCYANLLPKLNGAPVRMRRAVAYALVANTVSFALGLWLAHIIPGIF